MAYRTECRKTVREFAHILKNFLTNPVSMDELDYSNSSGNGNIENINFNYANAQTEQWTLTYDGSNGNFTVQGSVSGSQGTADINTLYDNGIISFTIRNGSDAWADGDVVLINCTKGSTPAFEYINSGVYRKELKAELQGVKNIDLSWNSYSSYSFEVGYYMQPYGKLNKSDFLVATMFNTTCGSIDSSHKLNQVDCSIILTVPNSAFSGTDDAINLSYFTSNNITSETTKNIRINLLNGKYIKVLDTTLDISSYVDNISDWQDGLTVICINLRNSDGYVEVLINNSSIASTTIGDLAGFSFAIRNVYIQSCVSFYYWNRLINSSEIQTITDNGGFPTKTVANDYYASFANATYIYDYLIVAPARKFGFYYFDFGDSSIKYRYTIPSRKTQVHCGANAIQSSTQYTEYGGVDSYYHYNTQYIDFGEPEEILDKYWIVQDGNNVLLILKHFDPTKFANPVYNLFYIGWTNGDVNVDYPLMIGMKAGSFNWYDTQHSDYRFGLFYGNNVSVARDDGWYNNYITTPQMSSYWNSLLTTDNFTTVMRVNLYHNLSNNTEVVSYGTPKWLYVINTSDITPETEIYINGLKYIVIPDNSDSGSAYKFLVELNPE